jgi:hypothetical protein
LSGEENQPGRQRPMCITIIMSGFVKDREQW